jgi:ribulose-phosphate 3-epimerase
MIEIIPAPGTVKTFEEVRSSIEKVAPFVSWIHLDIADMTLVQNDTFRDLSQWKGLPPHLSFEAHLMVSNPEKYIRPLVDAGFKRLIAHVECQDPRRFIDDCQYEEIEVGMALDGPSAVEEIEPFFEEIDVALIMGYQAGFSGQEFQQETLEKLKAIRVSYPEVVLEVDGGVNDKTAPAVKDAGATRLVTTTYLLKQADIGLAVSELSKDPMTFP